METNINLHGYCAALLHLYKNQAIEIYMGDTKTVLKQSDCDVNLKNVIVGVLKDAIGDCLILTIHGTDVLINVWGVKLAIAYDSPLYVKDVFTEEIEGFGSYIKKTK